MQANLSFVTIFFAETEFQLGGTVVRTGGKLRTRGVGRVWSD